MESDYVFVNGRKTVYYSSHIDSKKNVGRLEARLWNITNIALFIWVLFIKLLFFRLKQGMPVYVYKEEQLVYLSGQHIVLYDLSKKRQSFLLRDKDEDEATVMSICVNYKEVLTIALGIKQSPKSYGLVKIYKAHKKGVYILKHEHLAFGVQVKDIHLIHNAKYCATLCCSHGSAFVSVFKSKDKSLISYVDTRDQYIGFFGQSVASDFGLYGQTFVKQFKFDPKTKQLDEELILADINILSVTSFKSNFCLLTNQGIIQYYKKNKLSSQINIKEHVQDQPVIMRAYSAGLIVGFSDNPILAVFEIHKGITFKKTYKLNIPQFVKVACLSVGAEDSYISILAQLKQRSDEPTYEVYLFNFGIVDIINIALRDPFEQLYPNQVHKSKILSLELSPCKSIILSLSDDRQLKVWEFFYSRGEFRCLYSKILEDQPLSMALHPLSFQCALGYRDGLRYFFVLQDEIKFVFYENVKLCTAVKYNQAGSILAAGCQKDNNYVINLYDPHTYNLIRPISGHSGQIQSLDWNDQILTSTCTQGIVLCNNSQTRIVDHSFKTHKAFCQTYDPEYDFLVGSYADYKVRIFNDKGMNLYYEMDTYPMFFTTVNVFKLLEIIVFGTSCGKIRVYLWPFTKLGEEQDFLEYQLHVGAITQLRISSDLAYMITGGEDGCIQVCKLKEFYDGKEVTAAELMAKEDKTNFSLSNLYNFNQLAFVSRTSQEQKSEQAKVFDFQLANLKSEIEDQKQEIIQKYNRIRKDLEISNSTKIADQKEYLSQIMEDADAKYKKLDNDMDKMRKNHLLLKTKIQQETESGLLALYKQSDILSSELSQTIENNDKELQKNTTEFATVLMNLERDFNGKFGDLLSRYEASEGQLKIDELKFKEVISQTEKENEILLKQEMEVKDQHLKDLQEKSEKIRSSNTKLQKECERFLLRKIDLESLIKETRNQIDHLEMERQNFKQSNKEMKQQLKDKEKVIFQKEKEIKNYRNKNGHLQNFKNVNQFKLDSLQEEKAPLGDHRNELDQNIKVMYEELTDEASSEKTLETHIQECEQIIRTHKIQLNQNKDAICSGRGTLIALQSQVLQALSQPNIEEFKVFMKQIHHDFFVEKKLSSQSGDDDMLRDIEKTNQQAIKDELFRQRDFLSKKINTVTRISKQNDDDKNMLIIKVQNENTQLIKNCNELREQRSSFKSHLVNMEKALDIITKEINALNDAPAGPEDSSQEVRKSTQPFLKKSSQPKLTPFQRYHQEIDVRKSEKILPRNKPDLHALMKEIKMFNTSDTQLREQVQQFLKNDESSILPHIYNNQSQEDTLMPEHSIIQNTSLEAYRISLPKI